MTVEGGGLVVSLAAVFSVVTQRPSPEGGALRDDTKNGCEGDYRLAGWGLLFVPFKGKIRRLV